MRRWAALAATCVWLLALAATAVARDDTPEEIRAKIEQEQDAIKRARLEVRLAELFLVDSRKLYDDGDPEKGLAKLREVETLVRQAYDRMFATGNNPRRKPRGFKDTEIKLREFARDLEDLRVSLPTDERGDVEKVQSEIKDLQENLLHALMSGKEKK